MIKKISKFFKFYFWNRWKIPKGDYCYKIIGSYRNADRQLILKTRICPYWKRREVKGYDGEFEGYCIFLESSDALIDDQCKCCGIREDKDIREV